MATKKFTKEQLIDELDLPSKAIHSEITGHSRWSTHHSIVFEFEGKHYQTEYSRGATEIQDEGPWEYEEEIECIEVHKVPKTIQVWEPIDKRVGR